VVEIDTERESANKKGCSLKNLLTIRTPYSDVAPRVFLKIRNGIPKEAICKNRASSTDHEVSIVSTCLGDGQILKEVIDKCTGEVLLRVYDVKATDLFPGGHNTVIRPLMITRYKMPDNAWKIEVKTPDGLIYFTKYLTKAERLGWTENKGVGDGRGRTRGKPKQVKIAQQTLTDLQKKLDDDSIGFFFRLSMMARHDTGLLAKRKIPLSQKQLAEATGYPEATFGRKFKTLIKEGVIIKEKDGFYLDKRYKTN